jgi:hypothetical protein
MTAADTDTAAAPNVPVENMASPLQYQDVDGGKFAVCHVSVYTSLHKNLKFTLGNQSFKDFTDQVCL